MIQFHCAAIIFHSFTDRVLNGLKFHTYQIYIDHIVRVVVSPVSALNQLSAVLSHNKLDIIKLFLFNGFLKILVVPSQLLITWTKVSFFFKYVQSRSTIYLHFVLI